MRDELHSFGNYEILEKLASGGMASVFLAKRRGLHGFEKIVAIKKILEHLADNEEFLDMFVNEAKLAAQLTHQNIVQIFELGKIGSSFFMVMEYVKGKDLRHIIKACYAKKINIPLLSLEIIRQVCSGLDYAHRKRDLNNVPLNIVHRDISPQNILVTYEGEVKVVDFGIAKAAIQNESTRAGVLKGKVSYMSPEQAWGKLVDHRSDIFSTGIILYELITGKKCFKGATPLETLEFVREANYTPPLEINPKIPEDICKIIKKSMAKNTLDRYQYCSEMKDDIERFIFGSKYPKDSFDLSKFMHIVFKEEIKQAEEHLSELIKKGGFDLSKEPTEKAKFSSPETTPSAVKTTESVKVDPKRTSVTFAKDMRKGKSQSTLVVLMKSIIYFCLPFLVLWNFYPSLYSLLINSIPIDKKSHKVLDFHVSGLPEIVLGFSHSERIQPVKRLNPSNVQFTKIILLTTGVKKVLINNLPAELVEKDGKTYVWGIETNKKIKLMIYKDGFRPIEQEIFLNTLFPIKAYPVKFLADKLIIRFVTEPPGAKITLNNLPIETKTPYEIIIATPTRNKPYEFSLEYKNFGIYTSTFLPGNSTYYQAYHKFVKEYGTLKIKIEPKGLIFMGRKQIGLSKGTYFIKRMLTGKYKLKIYNPDAEVTQYITVKIEKGKVTTKEIKLNVNIGWVKVVSNPPNLRVVIDGVDAGFTPIE